LPRQELSKGSGGASAPPSQNQSPDQVSEDGDQSAHDGWPFDVPAFRVRLFLLANMIVWILIILAVAAWFSWIRGREPASAGTRGQQTAYKKRARSAQHNHSCVGALQNIELMPKYKVFRFQPRAT
jgi:hypothetical protein